MADPAPDQPAASASDSGYRRPVVDVAALQALLDGRYAGVRTRVRSHLGELEAIAGDPDELSRVEYRAGVTRAVLRVAELGLMAPGFPEEYGGSGDVGASVAAFETLALGDLSVLIKSGVQFGLFGGAIHQLGTRAHHQAYLADLVAGRLWGCFAMTETGHGSDVQRIGTAAVYDPASGEFVVTTPTRSARKDYIGNAAVDGEIAVVFAQLETDGDGRGVHAFVVPLRRDGTALRGVTLTDCGPKMGLNGVDNGRITFDGVRIPRAALLDRFASVSDDGSYSSPIDNVDRRFFTMLGTLVQGRVSVAGAGVSAAKTALTLAVRYAAGRHQFVGGDGQEQLLLDYGSHQRRLFPLLARTYALSAAQEVLTERLHDVFTERAPGEATVEERARRELESRAAGTKALATWHATRTIQECREACGGAGYLAANRFARLKADTDVFTTFEGDNHVLLQLVAKGLLTDFRSEFSDLDQLGMVRFVASQAVGTVLERSRAHQLVERVRDLLPGGDSWDQEAGLLDPAYQLAMLRFREAHQLEGLARRLKAAVDGGMEFGAVFSRLQPHVIATARSHVERLVAEALVARQQSLPEGDLRVTLGLMSDLHVLSLIESDRGWFQEHGRLTATRSKAITREVTDLCRKVRPLALDLVAAFDIPDELADVEMLADNPIAESSGAG